MAQAWHSEGAHDVPKGDSARRIQNNKEEEMKLKNAPARKLQRQIVATNRLPTENGKRSKLLWMTDDHIKAVEQARTIRTKKRRATV